MDRTRLLDTVRPIRRDRHNRGIRGQLIPTSVPAWRTRADKFADILAAEIGTYQRRMPDELAYVEFGTLDAPDTQTLQVESGIPLASFIPSTPSAQARGRIVFYRLPILHAAAHTQFPRLFIHDVVTEQIAGAINQLPENIDFIPRDEDYDD
ncbi:MAG: metallopeptidase family protein [Actinomycetaceae bacterium]|nr:metallopeptidase family protein [Actinomycetaceae bacterium]MDY6082804.1 metallopeptidase family protein [Actinomycetaceae bacterium]